MIQYRIAAADDMDALMGSRLETLRAVNGLEQNYLFNADFLESSREYFLNGNHSTVLASDGGRTVGCASLCYLIMMPTFSHPSGKRAHLMNVYTDPGYRRQGIASRMLSMLIREAWDRGVTEISLDATESGRPLYRKFGFRDSGECMVLERPAR